MYIKELVNNFGLDMMKPIGTLITATIKLNKYLLGKEVEKTLYKIVIGILLYLAARNSGISYKV